MGDHVTAINYPEAVYLQSFHKIWTEKMFEISTQINKSIGFIKKSLKINLI